MTSWPSGGLVFLEQDAVQRDTTQATATKKPLARASICSIVILILTFGRRGVIPGLQNHVHGRKKWPFWALLG